MATIGFKERLRAVAEEQALREFRDSLLEQNTEIRAWLTAAEARLDAAQTDDERHRIEAEENVTLINLRPTAQRVR